MTAEIASFTIMFREALEAALVISIISTYLSKIGRKEQIKYLWYGSIIAIVASIALGGTILVVYSTLSGIAEEIFEGVTSLIAAGVLTFMIIWMAKNARGLKHEIQQRIDVTLTGRQIFGIASLAFIVVFREGLETVLWDRQELPAESLRISAVGHDIKLDDDRLLGLARPFDASGPAAQIDGAALGEPVGDVGSRLYLQIASYPPGTYHAPHDDVVRQGFGLAAG